MITRAPRPTSNFYMLDKAISEDARLSWAARGMLVFLLGKPDNWTVSPAALTNETKGLKRGTGRDGVYAILKELQEVGYLQLSGIRDQSGSFAGTDYFVSEVANPEKPPHRDQPDTAQPDTARPYPANPPQVSIEKKQGLKKKQELREESAAAPTAPSRPAKAEFPIPEGVEAQAWSDYMEARKAKRAPMTATAMKALMREAAKAGVDLNTAVEACGEYNWQGFNAGWYADRTAGKPVAMAAGNRQAAPRYASATQATAERRAETMNGLTGRDRNQTPKAPHDVIDADSRFV